MKVCFTQRNSLLQIAKFYFSQIKINPIACEVGVLKGDNAEKILEYLVPKKLFLIDQWKTNDNVSDRYIYHQKFLSGQLDQNHIDKVNNYYGGDITDQTTYDNLHNFVNARFSKRNEVQIIRKSSIEGFNELQKIKNLSLDYCYIDASHEYQHVLDDLLFYSDILSSHGLLQINDCCHSDSGIKQNFGVLEAAINFCKVKKFSPLLITNTDWSDVIFCSDKNKYRLLIGKIVEHSNIEYVEIPNSLIGAAKVIGKRKNLSFS